MARQLRFHPLVADDISAAIDWYEGRSAGLGERFRSAVDGRIEQEATEPTEDCPSLRTSVSPCSGSLGRRLHRPRFR